MRKILVVVDMQKDFVDGSLGTAEAEAILANVRKKISSYPIENVYATLDTHQENYQETQEGSFLPVKHCIEGSDGWLIHESIRDLMRGARIFTKPTFGSIHLCEALKEENEKEPIAIEVIGLCTDICVITNALMLKAFMPEVPISLDETCCAGVTPARHQAALETMRSCQIAVTGGENC